MFSFALSSHLPSEWCARPGKAIGKQGGLNWTASLEADCSPRWEASEVVRKLLGEEVVPTYDWSREREVE